MTDTPASLPLPEDPLLAAWASALNDAGYFANVLDASWRYVYDTDELLLSYRYIGVGMPPIGAHYFSAEARQFVAKVAGGRWASQDARRAWFMNVGRYVLADTPGGRKELRGVVDPDLVDLVDKLQPQDLPPVSTNRSEHAMAGAEVKGAAVFIRLDDAQGRRAGVCVLPKPGAGMSHLATAAMTADLAHLARTAVVSRPDRRPSAILMADLEASTPLARHLFDRALLRLRSPSRTRR